MRISLVEEAVMNPTALPDGMRGMRRFRIEYGGHAEMCLMEGVIYLLPTIDPDKVEAILNDN